VPIDFSASVDSKWYTWIEHHFNIDESDDRKITFEQFKDALHLKKVCSLLRPTSAQGKPKTQFLIFNYIAANMTLLASKTVTQCASSGIQYYHVSKIK
jgi:hypothetical protein